MSPETPCSRSSATLASLSAKSRAGAKDDTFINTDNERDKPVSHSLYNSLTNETFEKDRLLLASLTEGFRQMSASLHARAGAPFRALLSASRRAVVLKRDLARSQHGH